MTREGGGRPKPADDAELRARAELEEELLRDLPRRPGGPVPVLPRTPPVTRLPTGPGQGMLWFLHHMEPGGATYTTPVVMRLLGPLDEDAVCRSVAALVDRHEGLRTLFREEDGQLWQYVLAEARLEVPVTEVAADDAVEAVQRELDVPFDDLGGRLPVRARLLRVSAEDHILVLVPHHVVSDAVTLSVLLDDLVGLYAAEALGGPPVPPPAGGPRTADAAVWLRRRTDERRERLLGYWRRRLAGLPPLPLPADLPPPARRDCAGRTFLADLPDGLLAEVDRLADRENSTAFLVCLAAYQVLLARRTGHRDLAVLTAVGGRTTPGTEQLVGAFANLLLLRGDLSGDPSFTEALRRVTAGVVADFEHHEWPYQDLGEPLGLPPEEAHRSYGQTLFILEDEIAVPPAAAGPRIEPVLAPRPPALRDLTLRVIRGRPGYCVLSFRTQVFSPGRAQALLTEYTGLLEQLVTHPGQPVLGTVKEPV